MSQVIKNSFLVHIAELQVPFAVALKPGQQFCHPNSLCGKAIQLYQGILCFEALSDKAQWF